MPQNGFYRAWATDGETNLDLGICVPEDGMYFTNKMIPTKRLQGRVLTFYVSNEHDLYSGNDFVAVQPNECFMYLRRLPEAKFCTKEGNKGLLFSNSQE